MAIETGVIKTAVPTSGSTPFTEDYTISGFGTPILARLEVINATADDTASYSVVYAEGWTDFTNQGCVAFSNNNIGSATDTKRKTDSTVLAGCMSFTDGSWNAYCDTPVAITDGIRVTWRAVDGNAYRLRITLFTGSGSAKVGFGNPTQAANDTITTSKESDLIFTVSGHQGTIDGTVSDDGYISKGIAVRNGTTYDNFSYNRGSDDNTSAKVFAIVDDRVVHRNLYEGTTYEGIGINYVSSTSFEFEVVDETGDVDKQVLYAALDCDNSSFWGGFTTSPTVTGDHSHSEPGFTPSVMEIIASHVETKNAAITSGDGGAFGVWTITSDEQWAISLAEEDGTADEDGESYITNSPAYLKLHDGTAGTGYFEGANASGGIIEDGLGVEINYSAVDGAAKQWIGWAIEFVDTTTSLGSVSSPTVSGASCDVNGELVYASIGTTDSPTISASSVTIGNSVIGISRSVFGSTCDVQTFYGALESLSSAAVSSSSCVVTYNVSFVEDFTDSLGDNFGSSVSGNGALTENLSNGGFLLSSPDIGDAALVHFNSPIDTGREQCWSILLRSLTNNSHPDLITFWDTASTPTADVSASISGERRFSVGISPSGFEYKYYTPGGSPLYWNGSSWTALQTGAQGPIRTGSAGDWYEIRVEFNTSRVRFSGINAVGSSYSDKDQGLRMVAMSDWIDFGDVGSTDSLFMTIGDRYTDAYSGSWEVARVVLNSREISGYAITNQSDALNVSGSEIYQLREGVSYGGVIQPKDRGDTEVLTPTPGAWDDKGYRKKHIFEDDDGAQYLFYEGFNTDSSFWSDGDIGMKWRASQGLPWQDNPNAPPNPVFPITSLSGVGSTYELVSQMWMVRDKRDTSYPYKLYLTGKRTIVIDGNSTDVHRIFCFGGSSPWGSNNSTPLWTKLPGSGPDGSCLGETSDPTNFRNHGSADPVVRWSGSEWQMYFSGYSRRLGAFQNPVGWSVGFATSSDGVIWTPSSFPVVSPGAGSARSYSIVSGSTIGGLSDTVPFEVDQTVVIRNSVSDLNDYGISRIRSVPASGTELELYHQVVGISSGGGSGKTVSPLNGGSITPHHVAQDPDGRYRLYVTIFQPMIYAVTQSISDPGVNCEFTGTLTSDSWEGPWAWDWMNTPVKSPHIWGGSTNDENISLPSNVVVENNFFTVTGGGESSSVSVSTCDVSGFALDTDLLSNSSSTSSNSLANVTWDVSTETGVWSDTTGTSYFEEDDDLFTVEDVDGYLALKTTDPTANIHSHFLGSTSLTGSWDTTSADVDYRGKILPQAGDEGSEIGGSGVTFLSQFGFGGAGKYYRLRRTENPGGQAFTISKWSTFGGGGTGPFVGAVGNRDTGVVPTIGQWYEFRVYVEDTTEPVSGSAATRIRAKVWEVGSTEPAAWQADVYDPTSSRYTVGKIGVWSGDPGVKAWADFSVNGVPVPLPNSLVVEINVSDTLLQYSPSLESVNVTVTATTPQSGTVDVTSQATFSQTAGSLMTITSGQSPAVFTAIDTGSPGTTVVTATYDGVESAPVTMTIVSEPTLGTYQDFVEKEGIRWDFDQAYRVMQFKNGDWGVFPEKSDTTDNGTITVTSVTPTPTTGRNGTMKNPSGGDNICGYDNRTPTYNSGAALSYPAVLSPWDSLVSTQSQTTSAPWSEAYFGQDNNAPLKKAQVLTVLPYGYDIFVSAETYRPTFIGTSGSAKTTYSASSIDMNRLPNLTPNNTNVKSDGGGVSNLIARYATFVTQPWIQHLRDAIARYHHPTDNMPAYHEQVYECLDECLTMALCDPTSLGGTASDKEDMVHGLVQIGLDLYHAAKDSLTGESGGPITFATDRAYHHGVVKFAGYMLEDSSILDFNYGYARHTRFTYTSDQITSTIPSTCGTYGGVATQSATPACFVVPVGQTWTGSPYYFRADVGSTQEHEHLHPTEWNKLQAAGTSQTGYQKEAYRRINGHTWMGGFYLMGKVLGILDKVGDATWQGYVNRWMYDEVAIDPANVAYIQSLYPSGGGFSFQSGSTTSGFVTNMFYTYDGYLFDNMSSQSRSVTSSEAQVVYTGGPDTPLFPVPSSRSFSDSVATVSAYAAPFMLSIGGSSGAGGSGASGSSTGSAAAVSFTLAYFPLILPNQNVSVSGSASSATVVPIGQDIDVDSPSMTNSSATVGTLEDCGTIDDRCNIVCVSDIWNIGLVELGQALIASDDEVSPEADLCRAVWPVVRRDFLRETGWNGAKRTEQLTQIEGGADHSKRWSYAYELPSCWVRILGVNEEECKPGTDKWEIELDADGRIRVLYTDEAEVYCVYITDVTNVSQLDSSAQKALGYAMALQLARRFGRSVGEIDQIKELYEAEVRSARSIDAMEQYPQSFGDTSLLDARN